MKKQLLLICAMLAGAFTSAIAQDYTAGMVLIDGIYYTLNENGSLGGPTATIEKPDKITPNGPEFHYTGEITVPSSVNYDGKDYLVKIPGYREFYDSTITRFTLGEGFTSANDLGSISLQDDKDLERVDIKSFFNASSDSYLPGFLLGNNIGCVCAYVDQGEGWSTITIDKFEVYGPDGKQLKPFLAKVGNPANGHITYPDENGVFRLGENFRLNDENKTNVGVFTSSIIDCTFLVEYESKYFRINIQLNSYQTGKYCETDGLRYSIIKGGTQAAVVPPADGVVYDGDITILENIAYEGKDIPVTTIENNAFVGTAIKSVKIPSNIILLGSGAFSDCSQLVSADLSEATNISWNDRYYNTGYCFYGDTSLSEIMLPDNMPKLPNSFFSRCTALQSVNLPKSVSSIGLSCFDSCSSLKSVVIPENVTTIGFWAFSGCSSLQSVNIPASVTTITDRAFYLCTSLKTIYCNIAQPITVNADVFDNSVYNTAVLCVPKTSVDAYKTTDPWSSFLNITTSDSFFTTEADENGQSLNCIIKDKDQKTCYISSATGVPESGEVTIPASLDNNGTEYIVVEIGQNAFSGSKISHITVPHTVSTIGDNAFENCRELRGFAISQDSSSKAVEKYCKRNAAAGISGSLGNAAFRQCTSLTHVELPENLASVGLFAFSGCVSLETINLPEHLSTIDALAFENCNSLTSLYLPGSLTTIGYDAFFNCTHFESVYYNTAEPLTGLSNSLFDTNVYANATLYVPAEAVKACMETQPWSNFAKIEAHDFSGIEDITADIDTDKTIEVYNLAGQKVGNTTTGLHPGAYILRQGGKSTKVMVK